MPLVYNFLHLKKEEMIAGNEPSKCTLCRYVPLSRTCQKFSLTVINVRNCYWNKGSWFIIVINKFPNWQESLRICGKATFPSPSDSPRPSRHYLDLLYSLQTYWDCRTPSVLAHFFFWVIAWADNRSMSNKTSTLKQLCLKGVPVPS